MKLLFLLLTIGCSIFTFLGAAWIITSGGAVHLAAAIVPMVIALGSLPTYFVLRAKETNETEQPNE